MVQHERIAEGVYAFQSEAYAQVMAGVVVGTQGALVIDTLALPEETLAMGEFIEEELQVPVRYVVNTHYHADHAWGNGFFPGAVIIGHELTRRWLFEKGQKALEQARQQDPSFQRVRLVPPEWTFQQGRVTLKLGRKTVTLIPLPGHSADGIGVLVEEDRVLFAGDVMMPLPYLVDGDYEAMVASHKLIAKMHLENLIPGHGEIVLRGEIPELVKSNLAYLNELRKAVRQAHRRKYPGDYLQEISVEDCGKSRVLLGGLAEALHQRNLRALYRQFYGEPPATSPEDEYD
ncbi:MAG TPA: MBL fold metallo-hydrolase [Anaerolineae bacterium]|nr:MBL fold metallo-hydrolase [Anaerolineae bacterium]